MPITDIAGEVAQSNLLDQSVLLALFGYIGQKSSDTKVSLPSELKAWSAKARKPRAGVCAHRPVVLFCFVILSSSVSPCCSLYFSDEQVSPTSSSPCRALPRL
jgi:hypothetical protein